MKLIESYAIRFLMRRGYLVAGMPLGLSLVDAKIVGFDVSIDGASKSLCVTVKMIAQNSA